MEEDWISDLPDYVLEHILSFLTLKEAVRTSILSKRWRRMNICSMLSDLNFKLFDMISRENSNVRRKNRRLINVMDRILLERSHESSLGIEKFFLDLPGQSGTGLKRRSLELKLERWMKCVANHALTELSVLMLASSDEYWNFPLETFPALQSLQKLALMGFQFPSLSWGDSVKFSSLRSLRLWNVGLDDDVMQKLLEDTPLLENLDVESCRGLKVLQVRQPQLKMVEIHHNLGLRKVVVNAPKLELLNLSPPKETFFVETHLPCLQKIELEESLSSTLKTLVEFHGLKLPIDAWFIEFLPLCPLLEHLSVDSCPTLQNMKFSTPLQTLKTLRLTNLVNMVNVSVIAPNLEKFHITAYRKLPVVELDGSDKLEVEIKFHLRGELGDLWYDRLANFLGFFNHSESVKLSLKNDMGCVIPKEKRNDLPFPLYGTKCLEFNTNKSNRRLLWEHVDFMLWLSPQATNLTIRDDPFYFEHPYHQNTAEMVLECVYEEKETDDRSSCACCELLAIKCWRHCLKEVRIQEFVGDEFEKESLKSWLWKEVEDLSITEVSSDSDSIYGRKYTFYADNFQGIKITRYCIVLCILWKVLVLYDGTNGREFAILMMFSQGLERTGRTYNYVQPTRSNSSEEIFAM